MEHSVGILRRIHWRTEHDRRPEWMQAILELGHDAKVPATAADCPEKICIFGLACPTELAVRGDYVDRQQVINGEAMLGSHPTKATAQR